MRKVNLRRLNDAKWIACNQRIYVEGTTMEDCAQLAEDIIRTYLGLDPEEWEEIVPQCE